MVSLRCLSSLILAMLLLWTALPARALTPTLHVTPDRTDVEMGDIITLTITVEGVPLSETLTPPDFHTLLGRDFDIVGRSANTQLMTLNGDSFKFEQWSVQLTPKRPGRLRIPALTLAGQRSEAIDIHVRPTSRVLQEQTPLYRLEATVDRQQLYVSEQGILTVRLYYRGDLMSGHVAPPTIPSAQVVRLSNQATYHKVVDNVIYTVYEWRYAFFPQQPGRFTIPAIGFRGQLYVEQQLRQAEARTIPLTVEVRPVPDQWPTDHPWLPARQVRLQLQWQGLDRDHPIQAGETVALTLTLTAEAARPNLLPTLTPPKLPHLRVYEEPPGSDQQITPEGVIGQKRFQWTFLPEQAGTYVLPARLIPWWNTDRGEIMWLKIPEKRLTVIAGSSPSLEPVLPEATASPADTASIWPWQVATGVMTAAALLFLLLWWRQRLRCPERAETLLTSSSPTPSEDAIPCRQPPETFYRWLLTRPADDPLRHHPAFHQLEQALFHRADAEAARTAQQTLCATSQKKPRSSTKKSSERLKSLYP